jgi:hypothetical protein
MVNAVDCGLYKDPDLFCYFITWTDIQIGKWQLCHQERMGRKNVQRLTTLVMCLPFFVAVLVNTILYLIFFPLLQILLVLDDDLSLQRRDRIPVF